MRYPLLGRFRGTVLGAVLGANLAQSREQELQGFSDVSKLMGLGVESLIELGKLDLHDWKQRQQERLPDLNISNGVPLKLILASLPVALFFHDNLLKLRHNLLYTYQLWGDDPVVRDGILAIGYTIALSLTEKLDPQTIIPQIIKFLGETPTLLPKKLSQVNDLLGKYAGLDRAGTVLNTEDKTSSAIAIAFYYILSTSEDFSLTVSRATRHPLASQTIGAIAGALSGAYNSTTGIPVQWLVLHSSTDSAQMLELTDALLAVWSGVYNLSQYPKQFSQPGYILDNQNYISVFAAPNVIRER